MDQREYTVCPITEFPEGSRLLVRVGDEEVGIFNVGGQLVAYKNRCAHQGGPVCRGRILGRWVEDLNAAKEVVGGHHSSDMDIVCPWHGWEYDLLTGRNIADPSISLKAVDVVVRDGMIYVRAESATRTPEAVPAHE